MNLGHLNYYGSYVISGYMQNIDNNIPRSINNELMMVSGMISTFICVNNSFGGVSNGGKRLLIHIDFGSCKITQDQFLLSFFM